jgi:hypothetical protein
MPGRHGTSAVPQDGIFVSFEKTTKEEKKSFCPNNMPQQWREMDIQSMNLPLKQVS